MATWQARYTVLPTGRGSNTKNIYGFSQRLKSMWNAIFGILMILAIILGFFQYIESDSMKFGHCGKRTICEFPVKRPKREAFWRLSVFLNHGSYAGVDNFRLGERFREYYHHQSNNREPNVFPMNSIHKYYQGASVNEYVVFTEGCRIYDFAPFELVHLLSFSSEPDVSQPSCDPSHKGELVKATTTHLYINVEYLKNYSANAKIDCCYQPFDRIVTPRTADNKYKEHIEGNLMFSRHCHPFKNPVVIEHQFVYVKCVNASNRRVYEDYFTFAVARNDVNYNTTSNSSKKFESDSPRIDEWNVTEAFNVLILGFDSMSRLNFLRQMPATASFIEDNGGVNLLGYNKVGYNTFPNLIPVLTGLNVSQLRGKCWPTRSTSLDDCPFIWKQFHEENYLTAYAEDNTFTSTFTYRKVGFREQPVDYYVKPYYLLCESQLKVVALNPPTAIQCLGQRKNIVRFVEIIKGFASNLKNRKHFGLFWFNGMSHDFLNVGRETDKEFHSMLLSLQRAGALNHTVIIALSDHGMRWGKFRETFQGFSEERLPLASILLPESFKIKFPRAFKNLRTNAKRLTVPFDLHETLLDILSVTRLHDLNDTQVLHYTAVRNISLFRPIPESRTCKDAGIPPEFCACSDLKLIDDKILHHRLGTKAVVSVNKLLRNFTDVCARLDLSTVDSVFEQTSAMGNNKPFSFRNREFFVRFRTTPGDGSFEALMQITGKKNFEIVEPLGVISRINMYHNDSHCIDDEILKLYCYCKGSEIRRNSVESGQADSTVNIITVSTTKDETPTKSKETRSKMNQGRTNQTQIATTAN